MATSGLSRRRVGTSTPLDTEEPSTSNPAASLSNGAPQANGGSAGGNNYGGGTALEGGGKVAFDPRDLETEGEGKSMPRLTILEDVLLLGIKDKQVRCLFLAGDGLCAECLVLGCFVGVSFVLER
jgi:Golgi phosphoprotein 3